MRHFIPSVLIAGSILVTFTGCEQRENMAVVPDRQGHAYSDPLHKPNLVSKPMPREGEYWYTVAPGDTYYGIAKNHGMTTQELIERNHFTPEKVMKAGEQIIVRKK